jgi:hypothetical protein
MKAKGPFGWPKGGSISPASETAAGVIRIATQIESDAGSDNTTAVTPAKLATTLVDTGMAAGALLSAANTCI